MSKLYNKYLHIMVKGIVMVGQNPMGPEARTTIDAMIDLLKKKGKIDITSLAAELGVSTNVIEDWAKVLEAGNIVIITHEVGKMFVAPAVINGQNVREITNQLSEEHDVLSERIDTASIQLDKMEDDIKNINVSTDQAIQVFSKNRPDLEKRLAEITKIDEKAEEHKRHVNSIIKDAEKNYMETRDKYDKLSALVEKMSLTNANSKFQASDSGAMQAINTAKAKLAELDTLNKNKDAMLSQLSRGIDQQVKAFHESLNKYNSELSGILKQAKEQVDAEINGIRKENAVISDALKQSKSVISDYERSSKTLSDHKRMLDDQYAKSSSEMKNLDSLLQNKAKELSDKINSVSSAFGNSAQIYSNLSGIKAEMEEATRDIKSMKQQVNDLNNQLKAMKALKFGKAGKKGAAAPSIGSIISKVSELESGVSKTKDKVNKAKKKFNSKKGSNGGDK